jgi:hypothetical protein
VPATHVVVIANGVDLTEYSAPDAEDRRVSAELGLDPNRCYGIFVGRLHPVKSVDTLVRALVDRRASTSSSSETDRKGPGSSGSPATFASARGFGSSAARLTSRST